MSPDGVPVAETMAEFARTARWEELPAEIRREAGRAWLNHVGCATGGASTSTVAAAIRGVRSMGSAGSVPLLAREERFGLGDAALLGSLSASAHTFDDTHLATITHPTGPVAAALAAVSFELSSAGRPVPGKDLLAALMVGTELECRVSMAISAGGSHLGWYMTGLSGGIGAAAAVARLLGLDQDGFVWAIGLAAAQACGTRATHGSMALTYVPGVAARNGLVAAYMAGSGFDCGPGSVDGRNGLLQVLTGGRDAAPIMDGLGSRYEVLNNAYKPYPCGIVIHPAIDACLHLIRAEGVDASGIEAVELRVHPDALNLCWRKLPETEADAQVSLFHWVAAALVTGSAGLDQGALACISHQAVRSLQEKTAATPDPGLLGNQAEVELRLRGGRTVKRFTSDATGSVSNPMTDDQLTAKFRALARLSLGNEQAEDLLALSLGTPDLPDAADVLRAGCLGRDAAGPT
ncbi:MmgE/PrpD family protein [uncultured Enterovirga sp.]|uniref:MmgE/PrpD family protein n=1 Tax=uncultured Enterovirga sp. TaxID=2026352 RepID=UPI0035C99ACC